MTDIKREADYFAQLHSLGLENKDKFYDVAFSRNCGLLSSGEQKELANARVGIPGLGGVGGVHLITLTRTGIGNFVIADFDTFGVENFNRQYGARTTTVNASKIDVMVNEARSINPYLSLEVFEKGLSLDTIDSFLNSVDIVVDSLDFFAFDIRRALFTRAQQTGKHVITAGPIGFSSAMLIFAPDAGYSFDRYFDVDDSLSAAEKTLRFQLGLTPRTRYLSYFDLASVSHESKRGPSLCLATQLCSGMVATEVIRVLLQRGPVKAVPHYAQFDPYLRKYYQGYIPLGNRNPLQKCRLLLARRFLTAKQTPASRRPLTSASEPALERILHAAIQAPSGDNTQPWRFKVDGETVVFSIDPTADSSRFNTQQRAVLISAGAVLENIRIAAAHEQLTMNVTYATSSGAPQPRITFSPDDAIASPLYEAMWRRCTNRKPYAKRPLLASVRQELESSIADFPHSVLHLVSDKRALDQLREAVRAADRVRAESRADHEFLYSKIRYTEQEVAASQDGFPLRNLEAGLVGECMLRLTKPWQVMHVLNKFGMSKMVSAIASSGMLTCSAAGLLTVADKSEASFMQGGQALQRLWLTATSLGLSFQPMTALTFYHLRRELQGLDDFPQQHVAMLEKAWTQLEQVYPDFSWHSETPIMLFRIGYARPISCHTLRRPLASFMAK